MIQVLASDDKTIIAFMSEGTYFGEIGILLTQKRTCSIQARNACVLFAIEKDEFVSLLSDFPLHLKYLKSVAKQRLQTTNPEDLNEEQNQEILNDLMLQQMEKLQRHQPREGFQQMQQQQLDTTQDYSVFGAVTANTQFIHGNTEEDLPKELPWNLTDISQYTGKFIIIPLSKFYEIWSAVFLVVFMYNLFYVPFAIGLDFHLPKELIFIDIIAVALNFADSILRSQLAVDKNLEIQVNKSKAMRSYIKTYFAIDVLSCLPFDYILLLLDNSPAAPYFRLLRLLKAYRVSEIASLFQKETSMNVVITRILILCIAFIILAHWFNCTLLYFARWEYGMARRFDGKTLLEWLQKSSSVDLPPPDKQTPFQLYFNLIILACCYMGSIVYGDIIPFTISEETISVIEMIIGRMFIAFLFAEMSSYVQTKYQAYNEHIQEKTIIMKWIELNGINPSLKPRVEQYFELKWRYRKGVKEEDLIMDLPQSLRKDVLNYIYEDLIANCEVFPKNNQGAITTITEKLRRKMIPKDEFVIRQGELAHDMYFILKGEVRVVTASGVTLATLGKYKHFGEMALINQTASVRSTSIIANTNVIAAVLSRKDFKLICEHYPEIKTQMQEIINQRARDSIKKGVTITNNVQQQVENRELRRYVTMAHVDPNSNQANNQIPAQNRLVNNLDLSMIEEESRKEQSVVETVSRSHSISGGSVKTGSRKLKESNQESLEFRTSQSRSSASNILEQELRNISDSKAAIVRKQTSMRRASDNSQKISNHNDSEFINNRRTSRLIQQELEIIQDEELSKDENENNQQKISIMRPIVSDSPFREQFSADFIPVNNAQGILQTQADDQLEESKRVGDSRPISRGSNTIMITDQHIFEKSLEENTFKITSSMRNEPGGVSMKDIEKIDDTGAPQNPKSINTSPRLETQKLFNQQKQAESITIYAKGRMIEEEKNLKTNQNLNGLVQFSSSQSNFEEYLWQFKGSLGTQQATFKSMFVFYAFKYILVFPISIYNIIFIPLQIGFSISFSGWYLFMEVLTIITYFVDLFLIFRHYRNLQKQKMVSVVPINSVSTEFLETENHQHFSHSDHDVLELKFQSMRIDLITSILALFPFSLALQEVNSYLFIVNFLRVLRMIKLVPGYRVLQMLKKYNIRIVRLLEIIISYYIVAHIAAGIMLSVGLAEKPDISNTWLNKVPIPLPPNLTKQNNSESVDESTFYIHAIYFTANTISHVAIGDLTSVTIEERTLNAFMILCFTFFYSLLFANISSIFNTENSFLNFNEKYQYVKQTLPAQGKKISQKLIDNMNMYFENSWLTTQGYDEYQQIFNMLPTQLMHDAVRERYREAFDSAIIFKSPKKEGELETIDNATLNSFVEMIQVRVYMPQDFLLKAGTHDENFYFILDGEVSMIGLNNVIIGILSAGSHFNTDIGQGDMSKDNYYGKSLVHLICQSITTIAFINKEALNLMYEAFPFWKALVRKLNTHTLFISKMSLERYTFDMIQSSPNSEKFDIELKALEDHITYSEDDVVYSQIVALLDEPKNQFIYERKSLAYRRLDLLNQHMIAMEETGLKAGNMSGEETPSKLRSIGRTNSKTVVQMSHIQRSLTFQMDQTNKRKKIASCFQNFYFSRTSRFRTFYDFMRFINTLYIIYAVPFAIAFINHDEKQIFLIIESISTFFSWFVILVKMRTPVLHKGGASLKFTHVFKWYLHNGMIVDLISALPFDLLIGGYFLPQENRVLWASLRLTRLIALLRLQELIEKFQIHLIDHSILVVSFKAVLFLTQLWHWTSCAWFFVNLLEYDSYQNTWLKQFKLLDKTVSEQYLYSIYYVIKIVTGVGQSDMIAYNNLERICFIIMINIGDALFAIAFGLIAQVQMHISENSQFQNYVQKMKNIEEFLNNIKAEDIQRKRVEEYFSYNFFLKSKKKTLEAEDLKAHIPYSIVQEVIFSVQKEILLPMFKSFKSDNMIRELSYLLKNTIYMPGDYIIVKDQPGEEMYFVIEGQVQVIAGDKATVLKTLGKGNFFGEIAIFMKIKRMAYVTAKTPCIIGILKKSDIEQIILSYPKLGQEFFKEANKRIKETLKLEEKKYSHAALNSIHSSQQLHEEEEDLIDASFVFALQQKIDNAIDAQSVFTDSTQQSLVKKIKRNSVMIQGMQDYFNQRRKSTQQNQERREVPPSPQFGVIVEDLEKHQKRESINNQIAEKRISKHSQVKRQSSTIQEEPSDDEETNRKMITKNNGKIPQFFLEQSSSSSSDSDESQIAQIQEIASTEQKITVSDEESSKQPEKMMSSNFLSAYNLEDKRDSRSSVSSKDVFSPLGNLSYKIKINDVPVRDSNHNMGDQDNDQALQTKQQSDKSLYTVLPNKNVVNRNKLNSTNMLPSFIAFKKNQNADLIQEETKNQMKGRRSTEEQAQDQNGIMKDLKQHHQPVFVTHHSTSPILLKKQQEVAQIQIVKRKYSEILFKQALESFKEDPFSGESPSHQSEKNPNIIQPQVSDQHQAVVKAVRRTGKSTTQKRRLSKVQMGKNLLLSNTAGLKLQWTVGL